jgi:hypothetical protein
MTSTRQTARFLINSAAIGQVIRSCSKIRKLHGDGPFIKVHQGASQLVHVTEINAATVDGVAFLPWGGKPCKLAVPKDMGSLLDHNGNLSVVLVEASSWNKRTTISMVNALWKIAIDKPQIFKEHYDVEGSAQDKNTVTRMTIGRRGANLRRLVARRGKAYVDRDVAPNRFLIIANSAKDALGIKFDIKREVLKISSDVVSRHSTSKPTRDSARLEVGDVVLSAETGKPSWFGLFTDAEEDSSDDEEDVPAHAQKGPLPRNPLQRASRSTKPTLAEMLEDSAVRGDTFSVSPALTKKRADEERIRMIKHLEDKDSSSGSDDMPTLVASSGEDIFVTMGKNCGNTDEWGME